MSIPVPVVEMSSHPVRGGIEAAKSGLLPKKACHPNLQRKRFIRHLLQHFRALIFKGNTFAESAETKLDAGAEAAASRDPERGFRCH